jgi:hypothetical protein
MEHIGEHEAKPIPTIFHDIMVSKLPEREKKLDRLCQEGRTFIVAGTETTAWCLSVSASTSSKIKPNFNA